MRPRYVVGKIGGSIGTLVFVLVFNFFLFRVVNDDPTASMFRGRNLTPAQIQSLREQFNLDGSKLEQFGAYVRETAREYGIDEHIRYGYDARAASWDPGNGGQPLTPMRRGRTGLSDT